MKNQTVILQKRVKLEIKDEVAFVTLCRPEKLNALDIPMFQAVAKAARTLASNKDVRAVILSGEGNAFCSGLDVKSMFKSPLAPIKLLIKPGTRISNLAQDVSFLWRELPIPVIAVTHGKCWGGGFQIALGADFRFSTPDCEFSIMETRWGLIPDMAGSIALRELVSIDVAKELTMTARIFSGEEAQKLGLVTHISDDPMQAAIEFTQALREKSPDAISSTKALFNGAWLASVKQALKLETKLQKKLIGRFNQRLSIKRNGTPDSDNQPYKARK